ncbi:hypothetical protein [Acidovorax sp. Root402]|uniref:hypothetical protein n=1 Tax=Acidovorax sp. Root402 TaxID=1736527 RepID=UPI001F18C93A|nr:hypothetical protein [Acidovorax sp. Root402]
MSMFHARTSMRILISGASGSGTSTVGAGVALRLDATFQDTDQLQWVESAPPFQQARSYDARSALMLTVFEKNAKLVAAGSVIGWNDDIEDGFDVVVFLYAPTAVRIERIKQRDTALFGSVRPEFLAWAAQYDSGAMTGRSLARHNEWLCDRRCPVICIDSSPEPKELISLISSEIRWVLDGT